MKYIQKNIKNEPTSLKETRSTPGSIYDDCNKNDIRIALLKEQGFICAYCMRRVDDQFNKGLPNTRIEHFQAQSNNNELQMNFLNMLGVCDGREGNPKQDQTCDKRRDHFTLKIDPRKPSCEQLIAYQGDGMIYSNTQKIDQELNEILGLNNPNLIRERGYVIKNVRKRLNSLYKKKKTQTWSKSDLTKELNYWKSRKNDKHAEYCMIAVYYLEKKIARL